MKYRLFLFNILSYIVLYHIVFEGLITFIYKFGDPYTPIGRLYRKYVLHQNLFSEHKEAEIYILLFNLLISSILFFVANLWYGKENIIKTFFKICLIFIITNIVIIVYFATVNIGISTIPAYVFYFLIPMSIMLILLLPLFWLNKKIVSTGNKK